MSSHNVVSALLGIVRRLHDGNRDIEPVIGAELIAQAKTLGVQVEEVSDGLFEMIARRPSDELAQEVSRYARAIVMRQSERGPIHELSPVRRRELTTALEELLSSICQEREEMA